MDQILKGIAASDHPDSLKKSLIQQLVSKAANDIQEDQCVSIFEISSLWMTEEKSEFLTDSGKLVLSAWGKYHRDAFQRYFTEDYLVHLLDDVNKLTIGSINYVRTSFDLLQHTPQIFSLYTIIRHRATSWINTKADIDFSSSVCRLLIDYDHCWPVGDHLIHMCYALVNCLSKTELPKSSKLELKSCIRNAGIIGALLNRVWTKNQNFIFPVLTELFKIISSIGPNPSVALGSIAQFFTPEIIDAATNMVARSPTVSDDNQSLALSRMISWLSWPGGKRVDQWIICFLRALAIAGKHSILIQVTLDKLPQVFSRLLFPMVRDSTMAVLSHMLLSFQHSPQAFHLIVEHIPDLVQTLKKENSVSSKACLQTLTELVHCLMYRHSGFPELYGPLLDCLQEFQKPSEAMIKKWLTQTAWAAHAIHLNLARVTPKSDTGRTGLVNLGNTCYMNSIIQALYMLDEFNSLLVSRPTSTALQRVLYSLQETFVFLKFSQRTAFPPTKFLHVARPPWFSPGTQQDCSEFLKYLLDKLEEEDRALSNLAELKEKLPRHHHESNMISDTFEGKLVVCHRCRRCNCVSCQEEAFTDLPLAFPQNCASVARDSSRTPPTPQSSESSECLHSSDRSLKGGDVGQRPTVPSISSSSQGDNMSTSEDETSSSTSNYPVSSSNSSLQGKLSNIGIGADDPSISLEEMLGYFFEPEVLEGPNQYFCEQCQSLQDAERSVVISKAPSFLVLTLKRFSYNVQTHQRSKILQNVTYPLKLKLSNVRIKEQPRKREVRFDKNEENSLAEERETTSKESMANAVDRKVNSKDRKTITDKRKTTIGERKNATDERKTTTEERKTTGERKATTGERKTTTGERKTTTDERKTTTEDNRSTTEERERTDAPPTKYTKQDSDGSSNSSHYSPSASPTRRNPSSYIIDRFPTEIMYALTSVIVHSGVSSESGHYYCYARPSRSLDQEDTSLNGVEDSRPINDSSWCLFNDSRVSYASYESFTDITKKFPKDTPYVLIYKNVNTSSSTTCSEDPDDDITQILMDAVNYDNIMYLKEIEQESRLHNRTKMAVNHHVPRDDEDDDDSSGPSSGSCGSGPGLSTPFNRFIF